MYLNVPIAEIIASDVVTEEDLNWAANVRIPYPGDGGIWARLHGINAAIINAIASGVLKEVEREAHTKSIAPSVISDYIAGPGGELRNMADGKMYDSKSEYRKSLKAHGMVEMGSDAPTEGRKEQRGDYDCTKELKEAIQQHLG